MSRIVMLEFEDNMAAEDFIQINDVPDQSNFKIRGLYFMPTSSCRCGGKRNLKDWAKAKKFGVPVCRKCKKVSPVWLSGIARRMQFALGNNLLEED